MLDEKRSLQTPPDRKYRARSLATRPVQRVALSILPAQPRLARPDDSVCPVGNLQLGEDVGDVVAYGLGADKQACGDLGVGVALGYEIEDLYLARGELGECFGRRGGLGCGEEVHEA